METEKKPRAPQLADKYVLRLPDGMRDRISELAKGNNRSMNAQIISMLQFALDEQTHSRSQTAGIDVAALAAALAPQLAPILTAEMIKHDGTPLGEQQA